jgi:hypothetical protein
MDFTSMSRNEACAAELVSSVDAVPSVSAIAITLYCGLTIMFDPPAIEQGRVRGVGLTIPRTANLLEQEKYTSYELGLWRLRRQYGNRVALSDEDARHCGRAILMPFAAFEDDVQRVKTRHEREGSPADRVRDLRALRVRHCYASDALLLERMEDLRLLAAFAIPKLRLVAG